jgi:SAM-dependent methyltransferase
MHASIYESGLLRDACGQALRPGGIRLTERAVELCRFPPGARLLDVGCGSGISVEYLRRNHEFNASGIYISVKLISEGLKRNPSLPLAQATAEALPCGDETLDGIFCECVLSLLHEPLKALKEFYRTLKKGGWLVLSDLYRRQMPSDLEQTCGTSEDMASSKEVQGWLSSCGFSGLILWEDHTRALQEMAAQIMLTHGSLECLAGLCDGAKAKPGYYLLVTGKLTSSEGAPLHRNRT